MTKTPKIFYFSTLDKNPTGGTKQHYRHVEILKNNGIDSFLVLDDLSYKATWFEHNVDPISSSDFLKLVNPTTDFVVLPEVAGRQTSIPGNLVIFNQNAYYSFGGYGFSLDHTSLYQHPQLKAILTVSENNKDVLNYLYPQIDIYRVKNGINSRIFAPTEKKNA